MDGAGGGVSAAKRRKHTRDRAKHVSCVGCSRKLY